MHHYSKTHAVTLLFACGILCFGCVLLAGISTGKEPSNRLTAQQILDKAATTYADCKSYRDSGVVTEDIGIGSKRYVTSKPFRTAFIRPDQFRFECDGSLGPYIIWARRSEVFTWVNGVRKPSSLSGGIAGATGVSSGSAHAIPALLLSDQIGGNRISAMTELTRLPDETIDGTPCFKLEGKFCEKPRTVWFEKDSFLVRRIFEQSELANSTIDYWPTMDKEIAFKELEFNAPKTQ